RCGRAAEGLPVVVAPGADDVVAAAAATATTGTGAGVGVVIGTAAAGATATGATGSWGARAGSATAAAVGAPATAGRCSSAFTRRSRSLTLVHEISAISGATITTNSATTNASRIRGASSMPGPPGTDSTCCL